jgi:hypothetical protein
MGTRTGEVFRFDEDSNGWLAVPSFSAPFFMRRPIFASLKAPATWLYVLFGLFILACVVALFADADQIAVFNDIDSGQRVSLERATQSDDFYAVGKLLQFVLIIAMIPFFIWWTRRATCNVSSLGALDPKFGPGSAIGWWFVPVASWWQPLRVLNQAWRASAPTLPVQDSEQWRNTGVTPLLLIWWLFWMIGGWVWGTALGLRDDTTATAAELADAMYFILAMDGVMVVTALLALAVVAMLTARQERANDRFDLPAEAPRAYTSADRLPFGNPAG